MCRELAEIGMDMARLAAEAARQEWPAPPPPTSHQPRPATADADRDRTPAAPRPEAASPSLAFARIARAVRQIIALEAQIAAGNDAAIARAARIARDRAQLETLAPPRPTETAAPPATPRTATEDVPFLLARIGREMGVDLQSPAPLPRFLVAEPACREHPPPPG